MSETKTKWDSIVSDDALSKAKTQRGKTFVEAKERRVALPELIEELGNDGFLDLEARVNASITARRCVIATGGSAIYRGDIIERMKENGIVVYLKIPYKEVERRLGNLKERGVVLRDGCTLRDLYNERAPLYEAHADYIVELERGSVEENAETIRRAIAAEIE